MKLEATDFYSFLNPDEAGFKKFAFCWLEL